VDVRLPESLEEPTDDDLDARDAALDAARDVLEDAGWMFALEGGNAMLAWRLLPDEARTHAEEDARSHAEAVLTRALKASGSVAEVRVYAHAAPSEVTSDAQGRPRLAGSELLKLERWAQGGAAGTVTWADGLIPR
jgi:eukaryotic-like serine/threonine-protein kinase